MAQLETYAIDNVINNGDTVIGADAANSNVTRRFTMEAISDYVRNNVVLSDLSSITATAAEINVLDGITASVSELNILDGVTATAAEINIVDGLTATTAELNFVSGVTSNIQTQLDGKASAATGAITTVVTSDLTASRALLSNSDGKIAVSDVTSTELGYLDGVTSSIQTQINDIVEFDPENTGNANQVLQRTSTGYQWADASAASYTLVAATATTLGGVIVPTSSDIDIDSTGNLTLGNISANKITSGTLGAARLPDITTDEISSGSANDGYILTADGSGNVAWEANTGAGHIIQDDGTDVTDRAGLNFGSPFTVTDDSTNDRTTIGLSLVASDIPSLNASKINAGVLQNERLSADTPTDGQVLAYKSSDDTMEWVNQNSFAIGGDDFGTGEFQISTWARGNYTGTIPVAQIPNLSATKITSGLLDYRRLSSDTPVAGQALLYNSNGTMEWGSVASDSNLPNAPAGQSTTIQYNLQVAQNGTATWEEDTGADGNLPDVPDAADEIKDYNLRVGTDGTPTWSEDTGIDSVAAPDITAGTLDDDVLVADQNSDNGFKYWYGTQDEYNAISTKDDDTIYITDGQISGVSGEGRTIQGNGGDFTDRANLNFQSPLTVTDDSTNDATVIDITLAPSDIPDLDVSKITTGVFGDAFIPNFNASKINAGTFDAEARINSSPSGTNAADGYVLTADGDGNVSWEENDGGSNVPNQPAATDNDTEYVLKVFTGGSATWTQPTSIVSHGTWTPVLASSIPNSWLEDNLLHATWTKIGSMVSVYAACDKGTISALQAANFTGDFSIRATSLPFTFPDASPVSGMLRRYGRSGSTGIQFRGENYGTYAAVGSGSYSTGGIYVYNWDATGHRLNYSDVLGQAEGWHIEITYYTTQ